MSQIQLLQTLVECVAEGVVIVMMAEVSFAEGDLFASFDAVKERIELYSKQSHVPLSISDSRTIRSAVAINRLSNSMSEEKMKLLHYYEVKFTCIHGGRKHRNRGTGKRKSSTFKKGCPCFIAFRLDGEKNNLVVTKVNTEHANHEVNENLYEFYPKVRKLSEEDKSYAEQMLAMSANKKILQQQLKKDTGKFFVLLGPFWNTEGVIFGNKV